jgi:hypothetical protein
MKTSPDCCVDEAGDVSMQKIIRNRMTLGLLLASGFFSLACICCPINLLPIKWAPPGVSTQSIPTTTQTFTSFFPSQACTADLSQLLDDSQHSTPGGLKVDEEYTLVTYSVAGDVLSDPQYTEDLPAEILPYQQDAPAQEIIWTFITEVIPVEQRSELTHFVIFTDGVNKTLGAVEQTSDPQHWMLEMDIEDAGNMADLSTTLIHEFAHLLTLNETQVQTDYAVLNHPDDQAIYDQEALVCPAYFMYEGCSKPESYINTFFSRFWGNMFDEWKSINAETDENIRERKLDNFYQEYADRFVSKYAVTSPEEDIAESFMFFIFSPKPSPEDMAAQKILFFYEYPELASLREHILGGLCEAVNGH